MLHARGKKTPIFPWRCLLMQQYVKEIRNCGLRPSLLLNFTHSWHTNIQYDTKFPWNVMLKNINAAHTIISSFFSHLAAYLGRKTMCERRRNTFWTFKIVNKSSVSKAEDTCCLQRQVTFALLHTRKWGGHREQNQVKEKDQKSCGSSVWYW
jgi:hypothetical protein